ncbi:MAG: prolipoprotein diacylglyceryl transferase [Ruminococcaceae bacterium]|nr:prolipoprotein diacylglyceryl transferase [Oscillospiraceae bacterium]
MTDSPIRFPGLFGDWTFTAPSKALNIGHGIYWYGIIIAVGLVLALAFCMRRRRQYGLKEDDILDTVLWGIPFGIIGARLYYVIFYLDLYRNADGSIQWSRTYAIWDGGLAIYGTVIAVVIVALCVSRARKFKFFALMDLVVMGLLIGQAVGRWGNFMNREAFGVETTLPWRMQLTTVTGQLIEVHPTFLYESLWNLLGLILIATVVSKARRFDGENTCFYFLWYGFGRFWIEGLRTDSLYLFNWTIAGEPIRVSQALSLVMVVLSLFMLLYHIKLRPHSRDELYVNMVAAREAAAAAAAEDAPAADDEAPAAGTEDTATAAEAPAEAPAAAEEERPGAPAESEIPADDEAPADEETAVPAETDTPAAGAAD